MPGRDRLHRLYGPGGLRAREPRGDGGRRRRRVDRAAVREAVRRRDRRRTTRTSRLATDAPLMVYNWVHGTAVDMKADLVLRLAEIDTIVALKDSTPSLDQFFETAKAVIDEAAGLRAVHVDPRVRPPEGARRRRLHRRRDRLRRPRPAVLGGPLGRERRGLPRARATHRGALPAPLAPGRLGREVRRLPEPAEGDHEDARPAGRRAPPPAPAGRRSAGRLPRSVQRSSSSASSGRPAAA